MFWRDPTKYVRLYYQDGAFAGYKEIHIDREGGLYVKRYTYCTLYLYLLPEGVIASNDMTWEPAAMPKCRCCQRHKCQTK